MISTLRRLPLLMYGVILMMLGLTIYVFGTVMSVPRIIPGLNAILLPINEKIVWYSGVPLMAGLILALTDLFVLFPGKRQDRTVRYDPMPAGKVTVALTAYNDEASIATAVTDFLSHPRVGTVIVVSNNSTDATLARAIAAGALGFDEARQGYGFCVHRCLSEAVRLAESDFIVLCEGDCTFRAYDIDKLIAYIAHADIVNGTRTVESLRARDTQLSTFMYYGNLFVGKLLEAKHLGRSTITDVGTTYKLCRRDSLERVLPILRPDQVNLEFNAYFLDTAIAAGEEVVECPVTFHPRVGVSKGGNVNNSRALQVGMRMIKGLVFGWHR
ncbi:MAG: glycosyltransferase [Acetobacteraceae bacterium]|nr:glycosyltransferase [Acetobacteraceae bacterium]